MRYTQESQLNIQSCFDMPVEDLELQLWSLLAKRVLAMPKDIVKQFKPIDIQVAGSFIRCQNKDSSDLDAILLFDGDIKPRRLLRLINYPNKFIEDKYGKARRVDFNPVSIKDFNSITEYIEWLESLGENN